MTETMQTAGLGAAERERLVCWLGHRMGDDTLRLGTLRAPKTGFSARTLMLSLDSAVSAQQHVVVRLEQPGHDIFLDTDIGRQAEMMRGLGKAGLRVPRLVGVETDRSLLGGQFMVTHEIRGESLPQHPSYQVAGLLCDLDEAGRRRLWLDAVCGVASINRLDWRGFPFLDRTGFGQPGLDQYLGWLRAWRKVAAEGRAHPVLDAGMAYLERETPSTDDVAVLWGDSNAGNMVFGRDGALLGMLDFEAAALGPGEIDLGWWFFMDDMLSHGVDRLPGLPSRAEQVSAYEEARGRKTAALGYYQILAGVRMTIVLVRTVERMVDFGLIPAGSRAALANPVTEVLARLLDIACEPTGADYMQLVQAMSQR